MGNQLDEDYPGTHIYICEYKLQPEGVWCDGLHGFRTIYRIKNRKRATSNTFDKEKQRRGKTTKSRIT